MRKIGIIGAMGKEIQFIKNELCNMTEIKLSGMPFYQGNIGDTNIILLECGVGKVNAAIYTQILIDNFQIEAIINTGIAGSLDNNVRHLSIVIADTITYYDVKKGQLINCFPYQENFIADEKLSQLLYESSEKDTTAIGKIITGDDFISDGNKKKLLQKEYSALCVEMEGAAIAHTAYVNKIPFCVVRCISDMADDSSHVDYKRFEDVAATKVAKMVHDTIIKLRKK